MITENDTEQKKITLRLPETLYARLKQLAETVGHSVTQEINLRLEESTSKNDSVESIITQIDTLLLSLKRSFKPTSQALNKKQDSKLINLISSLDSDKRSMVLKFIQSIT